MQQVPSDSGFSCGGGNCDDEEYMDYYRRDNPPVQAPVPMNLRSSTWVRQPTVYQNVSGGITIGQKSGPVSTDYYSDYPGDPDVPCSGKGCIFNIFDAAYRIAGPFLPKPDGPTSNNVYWDFTVAHSNGTMSPGDINFSTSLDDAWLIRVDLKNGGRHDKIPVGKKIDPRFGATNLVEGVPTAYLASYPLILEFTIQCNLCVNVGGGPSAMRWIGLEQVVYKFH